MSNNKIFCGSGKEKIFDNGGSLINCLICLDDIPEEHTFELDGKKFVKVAVCQRREASEKSTHYIEIDTFKATPKTNTTPTKELSGQIPF